MQSTINNEAGHVLGDRDVDRNILKQSSLVFSHLHSLLQFENLMLIFITVNTVVSTCHLYVVMQTQSDVSNFNTNKKNILCVKLYK